LLIATFLSNLIVWSYVIVAPRKFDVNPPSFADMTIMNAPSCGVWCLVPRIVCM
jgi:hypothetical protein